jgi:hypothetical protein
MGVRMTVYSFHYVRISTGSFLNNNKKSFSAENHLDVKVMDLYWSVQTDQMHGDNHLRIPLATHDITMFQHWWKRTSTTNVFWRFQLCGVLLTDWYQSKWNLDDHRTTSGLKVRTQNWFAVKFLLHNDLQLKINQSNSSRNIIYR